MSSSKKSRKSKRSVAEEPNGSTHKKQKHKRGDSQRNALVSAGQTSTSQLSTSEIDQAIQELCADHGLEIENVRNAAHISSLRPYATTEQWVFMSIMTQSDITEHNASSYDSLLFREAFDSYPGSLLQNHLHSLIDSFNYDLGQFGGMSESKVVRSLDENVPEFSVAEWAAIITFVFFHDTYEPSEYVSMNGILRWFWANCYSNIAVRNEKTVLASRGWSVDDVFKGHHEACWLRGMNHLINFRDSFQIDMAMENIFVTSPQWRLAMNPNPLDALFKYILSESGVDDISDLVDSQIAKEFWSTACQKLCQWMILSAMNEKSTEQPIEPELPVLGATEGPWRAFTSEFRDENGKILGDEINCVCYAFQWISTQMQPYMPPEWQHLATNFVLNKLSSTEQEILLLWSRNSTLFRAGFAPVSANNEFDKFAGIAQPMAYDMLDAIFEHKDIPRVTQREGMWVYRGLSQLDSNMSTVQLHSSQFISTSYVRDVSIEFQQRHGSSDREHGLLMKIWLPPGTPFLLLDAFNYSEHEILLPRNHTLRPFVVTHSKEDNTAHFRFVHKQVDQSTVQEVASMMKRNLSLRSNQRQVVREQHTLFEQQVNQYASGRTKKEDLIFTCRILQCLRLGRKLFQMTFAEQKQDLLLNIQSEHRDLIRKHINSISETWFIAIEATDTMASMDLHIKENDTNFTSLFKFQPEHLPGLCLQIATHFDYNFPEEFNTTLVTILSQCVQWWDSPSHFVIDSDSIPRTHDAWHRVFRQTRCMAAFNSRDTYDYFNIEESTFDEREVVDTLMTLPTAQY